MDLTREQRYAWADTTIEDLGGGVYRLPLPLPNDGLHAVNVYALVDDAGVTLVDGGWALPLSRDLLTRYLAELGAGLGDIDQFLITHYHRDHYSQALAIRSTHGTPVSLGENERTNLEAMVDVASGRTEPSFKWRLRRGGAAHMVAEMESVLSGADMIEDSMEWPDTWLPDGREITLPNRTLTVVATPGHTDGHVVFRDEGNGILFAGDHILPHITPSVGFDPAPPPLPLANYLSSLAKIRAMPDSRLLPAHGPVAPSAHARVDELLAHHEERLALMLDAVVAGSATACDVAAVTPWTRRLTDFADLSALDRIFAVLETGAHLDVLVARGILAQRDTDDGTYLYEAAGSQVASGEPS